MIVPQQGGLCSICGEPTALAGIAHWACQQTGHRRRKDPLMPRQYPFIAGDVVESFEPPYEEGETRVPHWIRLRVPEGLPELAHGPWAAALMGWYDPGTVRCWVVALAREELVGELMETYPEGLGRAETFAVEINPRRQITAARLEGNHLMSLNEIPPPADQVDALGEKGATPPGELPQGEDDDREGIQYRSPDALA